MRSFARLSFVVGFLLVSAVCVAEVPYELLDRESALVGEVVAVSADSAFQVACDYGMSPKIGEISVRLGSDRWHGVHWAVAYIDWAKVQGTSGFIIDAFSGAIVDRMVTTSFCTDDRREFSIDPREALVDSCLPKAPVVAFFGVRRGSRPPEHECQLRIEVEEAKRGLAEIRVLDLSDDRTGRDRIALRLENLGGEYPLPEDWGPKVPFYPGIKFHPDSLMFYITWDDGDEIDQERVSNRFAVYAIDQAGNECPEPAILDLELEGR